MKLTTNYYHAAACQKHYTLASNNIVCLSNIINSVIKQNTTLLKMVNIFITRSECIFKMISITVVRYGMYIGEIPKTLKIMNVMIDASININIVLFMRLR